MTTSSPDLLAPDTAMGAVTLRVADLDGMIAYYRDAVTLELLSHDGPVAVLGRGERRLRFEEDRRVEEAGAARRGVHQLGRVLEDHGRHSAAA